MLFWLNPSKQITQSGIEKGEEEKKNPSQESFPHYPSQPNIPTPLLATRMNESHFST
jgi:hypothetical protein